MKVTAIIPDKLVEEVRAFANEQTITASLIKALEEWTALQRVRALNRKVAKKPLRFREGFTGDVVRNSTRRTR